MENNETRDKEIETLIAELDIMRRENASLKEQLSIIKSASELFFSIYIIDLENDSYCELHSTEYVRESIKKQVRPQAALDYVVNNMILNDDKTDIIAFNDLSTLRKRLRMKAYITQDYKGLTSGWTRAYIMPAMWNKEGEITKVVYATHQIHREKELERQVERLQKEIDELKARLGE